MSHSLAEPSLYVTPEEYLAAEAVSETKHEYVAGAVYAMAGGSRDHGQVSLNIAGELLVQLRGQKCRPYASDVRVRIKKPGVSFYYYPDVSVDCSNSQADEIEEPSVIFEVLSPSTERTDRVEKLGNYQSIPSLRVYVLVDQSRPGVIVYRRAAGGNWQVELVSALDGVLDLTEIGCLLPLRAIYNRVF